MALSLDTSTIVPQAFRLMELTPPASLADDSIEAQAASEQYPIALRACLEFEDWSFARATVTLSRLNSDSADPDCPARFALPSDLIKVRHVNTRDDWRIEGREILTTHLGPLRARYTRMISDETLLPANFIAAVSYRLAISLAPQFVGSRSKTIELDEGFRAAIATAIQQDRNTASSARYDGGENVPMWNAVATI